MSSDGSVTKDFQNAIQSGDVDRASILLAANPDLLDNSLTKNNSLVIAVSNGQKLMAAWLQSQGAFVDLSDVFVLSELGVLPISLVRKGIPKFYVCPDFTEEFWEDVRTADDAIGLMLGYGNEGIEAIDRLLMLGAKSSAGLSEAVSARADSAVKLFIEYGADQDSLDEALHECFNNEGHSVFYEFFDDGIDTIACTLIEAGANVNYRDSEGKTLLHLAASSDDELEIVTRQLIDHGADVNALDAHNNTPLHLAASSGNFLDAVMLVAGGADIGAVNENGLTPLEVAEAEPGCTDVANYLRNMTIAKTVSIDSDE